nr:CDP-glycerol glycerophosphotransferase family protein [Eubacterium sp.]
MKEIVSISFEENGKLTWVLSESAQDQFERVFLYDEKEEKEVTDTKSLVNRNLTLRGQKKNGTVVCLQATDTLYETLRSTWFDAESGIHYFAQKGNEGQFFLSIWRTGSRKIKKGGYFLERVDVDKDRLTFHALDSHFLAKDMEIMLWNKKAQRRISVPVDSKACFEGELVLDLSAWKDELAKERTRWDVMLRVREMDNRLGLYRMEHKSNCKRRRAANALMFHKPRKVVQGADCPERFLTPIPVQVMEAGEPLVLSPNYNEEMQLSLQGVLQKKAYIRAFHEKITKVELTEETLTVQIWCKNRGFQIKGLSAVLQDDSAVVHPFQELDRIAKGDGILVTYQCVLTETNWQPVSYHFVLEEEKDGVCYDIRPRNVSKRFRNQFYRLSKKNWAELDDKILIILSTKIGNLMIRYRDKTIYDEIEYRKRERKARLLYLLGKPIWDRKNIILMCERFSTAAQDNGFQMFKYYMEQGRKNVFYVIRYDMPDYQKVAEYGDQVLEFMSLRHMIYVQAAKVIVSTDTKKHVFHWQGPCSRIADVLLMKPIVFLQHGVLAMKKVSRIYDRNRSNAADLFITSSELEKKFVNESFHYEPERIAVTGLARWDVLIDKSEEQEEKEILFIPTWRSWMDNISKEDFLKSEYYHVYKEILESKRLEQMLKEYNLRMVFCMHHKFREFAGEFSVASERIERFDFGDTPVNELIMRSSCLVTDYSSVAWDSYYLGKPCIFYQFDYEKYMELQGSYFDMEKELFGVRVTEQERLFDAIEECVKSGFSEKEEYAKLREYYLPYRDRKHRERIDKMIQQMKFNGKTEVL